MISRRDMLAAVGQLSLVGTIAKLGSGAHALDQAQGPVVQSWNTDKRSSHTLHPPDDKPPVAVL